MTKRKPYKLEHFIAEYNPLQYYLRKNGYIQPCIFSIRTGKCSKHVKHYSKDELKLSFKMDETIGLVRKISFWQWLLNKLTKTKEPNLWQL